MHIALQRIADANPTTVKAVADELAVLHHLEGMSHQSLAHVMKPLCGLDVTKPMIQDALQGSPRITNALRELVATWKGRNETDSRSGPKKDRQEDGFPCRA